MAQKLSLNQGKKSEISNKIFEIDKVFDLIKEKIDELEKENSKLHRIIDKFYETIEKFITWICKKFDIGAEDNLIRDFQKETNTFLDPEKQIKKEEREKLMKEFSRQVIVVTNISQKLKEKEQETE